MAFLSECTSVKKQSWRSSPFGLLLSTCLGSLLGCCRGPLIWFLSGPVLRRLLIKRLSFAADAAFAFTFGPLPFFSPSFLCFGRVTQVFPFCFVFFLYRLAQHGQHRPPRSRPETTVRVLRQQAAGRRHPGGDEVPFARGHASQEAAQTQVRGLP